MLDPNFLSVYFSLYTLYKYNTYNGLALLHLIRATYDHESSESVKVWATHTVTEQISGDKPSHVVTVLDAQPQSIIRVEAIVLITRNIGFNDEQAIFRIRPNIKVAPDCFNNQMIGRFVLKVALEVIVQLFQWLDRSVDLLNDKRNFLTKVILYFI